jgi:hypothetical protein
MNNVKKLLIVAIGLSTLSGCASGPTALEQALAMPNDMNRSISVDELLDQAITQPIGKSQNAIPSAALMNQPSPTLSPLLLTFMSNRSELTNRHQQKLQRFASSQATTSTSYVQAMASPLRINCAPSAEANPYAAASTGMTRCLNVSRFLEKSVPNTEISLKPDLPNNQIQISQ